MNLNRSIYKWFSSTNILTLNELDQITFVLDLLPLYLQKILEQSLLGKEKEITNRKISR